MTDTPMPDDVGFVALMAAEELWDGEMESFEIGLEGVLLLKIGGQIQAYDDACPHQGFPLVEGELEDGVLTCRAHEWQFDAASGDSVNPRGVCLHRHEVRVTDTGMVEVRLWAQLPRERP